jgi:hypothetical protein
MGGFQTVSSKTNRISDTKHNIQCITFLVLQAPRHDFLSSFRVTTSAPILYGLGHLFKVLYNGALDRVVRHLLDIHDTNLHYSLVCTLFFITYVLNLCQNIGNRVDDNPTYKCLNGRAGVGPGEKKDRLNA